MHGLLFKREVLAAGRSRALPYDQRIHPERQAREATLSVSAVAVELRRPNNYAPGSPPSLKVNIVTVMEVNCPTQTEPICWHLVTTEPIGRAARDSLLTARARDMRFALTPSEQLWSRIRGRSLGVVFRRQVPLLGRFIADFLAPAERLVVEVDGPYHAERRRADARRDAALRRVGYRVVRVEAELVMRDLKAVLERIRAALRA